MRGGRGWRPLTIQFGRSSATSVPSRRKRRSLPPKLLTHSRTRSALSAKMPYCRPCAISVQGRRGRAGDHRASSVPCRSRVSGRRIWRHRWRSRRWRRYTNCMRRFCSSEKRLPERRLREPDAAALSRSTESWVRSTRGRRSEVASEAITSAEGACRGPEWSGGAGRGWLGSRRPRAPRPRRGEEAASARARAGHTPGGHCSHPFRTKKRARSQHQQPASWGQPQGTLGGIWGREGRHGGVPATFRHLDP